MLVLSLYVVVFLFLSGLLACVDAAVLSVTRAETEELVVQKKFGALWIRMAKQRITQAVVVIVVVTNTINVLGPILVGQKAIATYGNAAIGAITAVLTIGTIIFSEIIPKSLGAHYAPTISRFAAPVVVALGWALFPLVFVLEKIAVLFQRGERAVGTETQIRSLVSIGLKAGRIEEDEGQLIHQAFVLNDLSAEDIMTPLDAIVALPETATVREAADTVFRHQFSRYPVWGKSNDDVLGMVLSREILTALADGRDAEPVTALLHKIPRVAAAKRSDALLSLFRSCRVHMATVHKSGRTIGLVTLEDVLEELVGEIDDESDQPEQTTASNAE